MLQNIITILGNDVLKCYTIYTLCRMNFIPAQWNARCFCKQVGILAVRVGKTEFHSKAHFSLKRRNFEVIFTYRLLSLFSEQIKILIWKFLNSDRRRLIENDSSEILRIEKTNYGSRKKTEKRTIPVPKEFIHKIKNLGLKVENADKKIITKWLYLEIHAIWVKWTRTE